MPKYRNRLPQLDGKLFLTDGGLETTLIFHHELDLPHFAAFDLMREQKGKDILRDYLTPYIKIAQERGAGLILESPTWRANPDWATLLGYSRKALRAVNQESIEMLHDIRNAQETPNSPMVISGNIGPRRDGYAPDDIMTVEEAQTYHAEQISAFADAGADMVCALTMTNIPEAIGVARAAKAESIPVAISFTVETDGRLPAGQLLQEAIETTDAETDGAPAYYMINCAHPTHFAQTLDGAGAWITRLGGIRANASKCSHAELDEAEELDDGNPVELGANLAAIHRTHPHINVLGGCCGTDHRHIEHIGKSVAGDSCMAV
ncbi:MAG: homocysteine S-methyltransferase [Rhodospirillaceae bacterium]|nr:homocysteine S-methyltransferase [Rhodospirillaceae bacterium]MBT5667098.1 homocysteine S-methyltransferase [Rhodospirillaceae bacterium]MBT5809069.1 homocysteine S-methyltransferase [Rhodospirillaceae bacterium]